ncbi:LAME_0B01838g1_1 [Lachancea meyersii CBS 8951]|uniref:Guanine nucleotide exchange factor LTE1 n=1 Tax=Lachancea meyersii CBS 8951 TaxID=1266667 RepID=A0A1G4ITZ5_9SACH|nr:LAME_0B01838g1_1 [Lachancea meyersii CBS 8951]
MSADDAPLDGTHGQSVFSEEEYYPTPSESKLSYAQRNNNGLIIKTDMHALIVKLTSPVDAIEYMFLSDFFLSYRKFLSPTELLDLLECRLQWAFDECMCGDAFREKIGQIASVRTFVVFRHWILNYFAQDFLTNTALRCRFVKVINSLRWDKSKPVPKLIQGIVVTIKKSWVTCLKLMWEDIAPEFSPSNSAKWLEFEIRDISQKPTSGDEVKRLSFYALQSSQNPEFRNRSVLSLYVDKENFQLPENLAYSSGNASSKIRQRTASMFLFPRDYSSTVSVGATDNKSSEHEKVGFVIPKTDSVTEVIKDLHCPTNPSVDKLIPPTPAKNIEVILRSSYLPSKGLTNSEEPRKKDSTGLIGLLSKWKRNHHTRLATPQARHQAPSFEIENFIKLVFSITSLESKSDDDMQKLLTAQAPKFDILSARTIDEVEFFIAKENELLSKIPRHGSFFELQREARRGPKSAVREGVSAMDNLNLYKTVSFLASSVISLSKTLQSQQITSPSYAAFERRRVNSADASLKNNGTSGKAVIIRSSTRSPVAANDGPRKLVFHGQENKSAKTIGVHQQITSANSLPLVGAGSCSTPNLVNSNEQSSQETIAKGLGRNSPGKLLRLSASIVEADDTNSEPDQSVSTEKSFLRTREEAPTSPIIKRKEGLQNLREFNFEETLEHNDTAPTLYRDNTALPEVRKDSLEEAPRESGAQTYADEDNSSFFTSHDDISIRDDTKHFTPASSVAHRSVTNTSGRISLLGTRNQRASQIKPAAQLSNVMKDDSFMKLDGELLNNQEEIRHLEQRTSMFQIDNENQGFAKVSQASLISSVPTDQLYASRNASPNKKNDTNSVDNETFAANQKLICLTSIPSIHSIVSGDSFSTSHTMGTFGKHSTSSRIERMSMRKDSSNNFPMDVAARDSLALADGDDKQGNKYLFSPDNDSIDDASPEKNVEDLKIKFISPVGNDSHSMNEGTNSINEGDTKDDDEHGEEQGLDELYREKHQNEHHRRSITPIVSPYKAEDSRLNNLAKLTDESLHGDPVNVALMKLEGTFDFTQANKEKQDIDIEKLRLRRLSVLGSKDRNSFLIERRRQVKSEIPLTPHSKNINGRSDRKATEAQIRELLKSYTLQDSRLDVSNADQHVPFILMYDSKSIAEQLTLVEREILNEIDWKELLDLKVSHSFLSVTSWLQLLLQNVNLSGIDLAIARFNLTVDWVISEIVLTTDNRLRRNTIQRFIHVADHCGKFQNYNTLMQIVLALSSLVAQSFRDAWRLIEPGDVLIWESLKNIPSLEKNYQNIRGLLNSIDPLKGCIPFIVVYLSDLTLNSEKNNWIVNNQVLNYSKFQTNVQIVKNFIQRAQWSKFYDFKANEELLSKCVYISCLSSAEITRLREASQ